MSGIKIVAMIDRSAGNDTVGEMWTETKVFNLDSTLMEVYSWAHKVRCGKEPKELDYIKTVRNNVKLSLAHD